MASLSTWFHERGRGGPFGGGGRRRESLLALVLVLALAAFVSGEAGKTPDASPHGRLSTACGVCHTTDSWRVDGAPRGFDHASVGRALTGAHASVTCTGCHRALVFSHIGASCADCHTDVHQGNLGTDCVRCHTEERWGVRRAAIEQHAATAFPLIGAHASLDCDACHRSAREGDYAGAPLRCDGCHLAQYNATSNPAHAGAGFGTHCDHCHTAAARDWSAAVFQHPASFPLIGGHARAGCADCHASGYRGTSTDCDACHERDFVAATNPNHVTGGFPRDCRQCHGYVSWTGASFDHATTGFPLAGVHATTSCQSCHASGYTGTPSDCYSCHEADFAGTTNPNHQASGFSHDCTTCHGFTSWAGASFDHATTGFPLAGVHATTSCQSCHASGYTGTPSDCYSCHQADFAGTTNPNHEASGFSHDCATCHGFTSWAGATFDHDPMFPIDSGAHRGAWTACSDCHQNPASYAAFECIFCHEHERTTTDSDHREVTGYVYQSSACYNCHPRGQSGG